MIHVLITDVETLHRQTMLLTIMLLLLEVDVDKGVSCGDRGGRCED